MPTASWILPSGYRCRSHRPGRHRHRGPGGECGHPGRHHQAGKGPEKEPLQAGGLYRSEGLPGGHGKSLMQTLQTENHWSRTSYENNGLGSSQGLILLTVEGNENG